MMVALSRSIYTATENEEFVNDEVRRTTVRAHRAVTGAINDRDPEAAVRRMTRHVHAYAEAVLKVEQRTRIAVPDQG